ncbi:MAG: hypothetical protein MJ196_13130, partial [Treponemataceae bacterium]|nr:hypothetical protein [Treponemataceae bacterium]
EFGMTVFFRNDRINKAKALLNFYKKQSQFLRSQKLWAFAYTKIWLETKQTAKASDTIQKYWNLKKL